MIIDRRHAPPGSSCGLRLRPKLCTSLHYLPPHHLAGLCSILSFWILSSLGDQAATDTKQAIIQKPFQTRRVPRLCPQMRVMGFERSFDTPTSLQGSIRQSSDP